MRQGSPDRDESPKQDPEAGQGEPAQVHPSATAGGDLQPPRSAAAPALRAIEAFAHEANLTEASFQAARNALEGTPNEAGGLAALDWIESQMARLTELPARLQAASKAKGNAINELAGLGARYREALVAAKDDLVEGHSSKAVVENLEEALDVPAESDSRTFFNDCGERGGVPYEDYALVPGEGFNTVRTRGLSIGVVFNSNSMEGTGHIAFMGAGCYCGEHETMESAVAAVQVAYFG